jgi:hypothetical protein
MATSKKNTAKPKRKRVKPPRKGKPAGGKATHAGTYYQNRVAAWSAALILAEADAVPPWDLPAAVMFQSLHAETPRAVDDLTVNTSVGGAVMSQAKHTIALQKTVKSALGSTISQFVREFRSAAVKLDYDKDRLVLVTTSLSSAPIKTHLPAFLTRLRSSSAPDNEWNAGNEGERKAAIILRDHVVRAWRAEVGADPTAGEITELLRLVRIQILDVDQGGIHEREAKQVLRHSVLADTADADAAWNTLITATGGYAVTGQSADRRALQRALTDANIALQAPRSFHSDIARLKDLTAATLRGLVEFSRIEVGGQAVTIQRPVAKDLQSAAAGGHLLVLGVPGAGKSGAIYELAQTLYKQKDDVVVLAVDQIEAASIGALRGELNLIHDLLAVLASWPGTGPGYLIIDALDAARSDGAIKTLQTLVNEVISSGNRWHVVASVRKFDLRYNSTFRRLFQGSPGSVQFTDGEFLSIRHVSIPVLTKNELSQVESQSPVLGALVSAASAPLQELLHLPFNLRLLAELLDAGLSPAELEPVRTQVELLDRYWQERIVRHDNQGDARELVLRRVTEAMITRRSLRIGRAAAVGNDAASGTSLKDLLSTHVLAEWATQTGVAQREFLTFPHHLLFDYAGARLYIPPEAADLVDLLKKEADLLIAIRPSIELHYQRLWHRDQASFWDLTFRVIDSPVNEVGKLLGPSVAALHATAIAQTKPLLDCLNDPARQAVGVGALQHILATLLTHGTSAGSVHQTPWIEFLDDATAALIAPIAYAIRPYTIFLSEQIGDLSETNRRHVGVVSRRLLTYALADMGRHSLLAVGGIMAVAKTVFTDPPASIEVLRGCITEDHLTQHGYRTFPTLARQAPILAVADATFIRDLYIAGFKHHDQSGEKTTMLDSQILPMSSNRKQDYEMGLWQLAEYFPKFLDLAPRLALDALLKITTDYTKIHHKVTEEAVPVRLDDIQSGLLRDHSSIWGGGSSAHHDDPLKMLHVFQNHLEKLTDSVLIRDLVHDTAAHQPPAVVWRLLLMAGTNHPETVGREIRFLAWDRSILIEGDTTRPAGEFLRAIFPVLSQGERGYVENAILEIPGSVPSEKLAIANRVRDRLLGCVDRTLLVTQEAVEHISTLDAAGGPPPNPPDSKIEFSSRQFTQEDFLLDRGVPIDDPEHKRILALAGPLASFGSEFLNNPPPAARVAEILPVMRALYAEEATLHQLHAQLASGAVIDLLRACEAVLRSADFSWDSDTLEFIKTVILRFANDPNPAYDPEEDDRFQEPRICGAAPRIDAARAIMGLARRDANWANDLRAVIVKLAGDPVAEVRYEIINRLTMVYKTAPDLMWQLLDKLAREEENRGVLQICAGVLQQCANVDPPRIAQLAENIFQRLPAEGRGVEEVRKRCCNVFAGLAIWHEDRTCIDAVERLLAAPLQYHRELGHIIFDLSAWLQNDDEEVRNRAFSLLGRILDAYLAAMKALDARFAAAPDAWQQSDRDTYGTVLRNVDEVATRLHLTSGAMNHGNAETLAADPVFYENAKPLLKSLASMSHPHTAHAVIETLVFFAALDPVGVLLLVAEATKASSANGYQYEQLGEELIVRMVERYLAEFRPLLREHRECHAALMEILDVFVRVGWPKAHQLTYRLSEIYR